MSWRQIIPTLVTLAAMLTGFFSILYTLNSMVAPQPEKLHLWAAKYIMLAMILDGLDGNLARWLKGFSKFGEELDTYVDMMAFGVAPALLIYSVSLHLGDPERVVLTSAVVLSGMVRLARFKVTDPLRGQGGYRGLPITACAGWVALFVFICESDPTDSYQLHRGYVAWLFLPGIIVFIGLQVSNVRYPKPTKRPVLFLICAVLVVMFVFARTGMARQAAIAMLTLGVGYAILGPFLMKIPKRAPGGPAD